MMYFKSAICYDLCKKFRPDERPHFVAFHRVFTVSQNTRLVVSSIQSVKPFSFWIPANSEEPDEMPPNAAFYQGLGKNKSSWQKCIINVK